ncbi:F-box/kelch-repeat protein [Prunus yedoensis var. nudiflora]|uniref:F-box/kelch-repeat protein n=1 Tax=Prunus yedoensis var. nudiflora TaxID=2094558 RepID=A0A314Y6G7_PRUYE|nr:F-box/kelch-repeat protein [Prunus yedoensis var. nudiflora]
MDNRCEDCFLDIWVVKGYVIKESWTKLITLGPQGPERLLPRTLCFRKNGEVLLMLCGARERWMLCGKI